MGGGAGPASGAGFSELARYIFGGNQQAMSLEMTTPVITTVQPGNESVAMQFVMEGRWGRGGKVGQGRGAWDGVQSWPPRAHAPLSPPAKPLPTPAGTLFLAPCIPRYSLSRVALYTPGTRMSPHCSGPPTRGSLSA